jgi:hypothetical protein
MPFRRPGKLLYNPPVDAFDFEKLAKEVVTGRLAEVSDVPAACAEVARKMIVSAVASTGSRQDPRKTVTDVCRGLLAGALLLNKELPPIAVALLAETATIAGEVNLDPMEMMTWAMEGIAAVCHTAGADCESAVQEAIEQKFMGAGEAFAAACAAAGTA